MRGIKVKTVNLAGKDIDEFIVQGIHEESELLKRAILNVYAKMGVDANDTYRIMIEGDGQLLLLRYLVIMDFKPTVLGVLDIGL